MQQTRPEHDCIAHKKHTRYLRSNHYYLDLQRRTGFYDSKWIHPRSAQSSQRVCLARNVAMALVWDWWLYVTRQNYINDGRHLFHLKTLIAVRWR